MFHKDAYIPRVPYPYSGILAVSSDLDGTRSADDYFDLLRFCNSSQQTALGPGLDLQLANSLYFAMPQDQFSYWNSSGDSRAIIRECIASGLIDTLHSYGDLADSKSAIDSCIDEIEKYSLKFRIWSNHSQAPSNYSSCRQKSLETGDNPSSETYHANRTMRLGIDYVALEQVTEILGQEHPPNVFRGRRLSRPNMAQTVKSVAKIISSPISKRYRTHLYNRVLTPFVLMDGHATLEVLRANWHPQGIGFGCQGRSILEVLTPHSIKKFAISGSISVLYTHLGQILNLPSQKRKEICQSLSVVSRCLAKYRVLTMTTADLLDYLAILNRLRLTTAHDTYGSLTVDLNLQLIPESQINLESRLHELGICIISHSKECPAITINGLAPSCRVNHQLIAERTWVSAFPLLRRRLPSCLT